MGQIDRDLLRDGVAYVDQWMGVRSANPYLGGVSPNRRKFCHAHVERRVP